MKFVSRFYEPDARALPCFRRNCWIGGLQRGKDKTTHPPTATPHPHTHTHARARTETGCTRISGHARPRICVVATSYLKLLHREVLLGTRLKETELQTHHKGGRQFTPEK